MSEVKVNKISPRTNCGTVTLGDSGDSFTIPAGVTITNNGTQTGFGRTGAVDWQTTKKTTDFTAVSGEGYFVDTGSGVVTVTLPASPSAGDIVYVKDYDGNFGSNKCTIARNGSNIRGATDNIDLEKNNAGVVCIYVDATEGWQLFFDGSDADAKSIFVEATGGNAIVTCGNFKTHIFTGPGTFTVTQVSDLSNNNVADYLVVGAGGGGGQNQGAGAGAGGFRTFSSLPGTNSPLNAPEGITLTETAFPITVGAGGSGGTSSRGGDGNPSVFGSITSTGGGAAGTYPGCRPGNPGGSGGGAGGRDTGGGTGGSGNTPPVSPPQGNNGNSIPGPGANSYGGGGGGAGAAGCSSTGGIGSFIQDGFVGPTAPSYGEGGPVSNTRYFAGGGGGRPISLPGNGGDGGGANHNGPNCGAGLANTGGGGGGMYCGGKAGGTGGSGVVMIRYKFQ
tara:strand:- start:19 stop:1362 length:1344 start_codon:yes stop_codon:yes gene_type:complete